LWLKGSVVLNYDKLYKFLSNEANIDMNKSEAWGDQPVVIEGDFGNAKGKGFIVYNSGEKIIIKGPAIAHIRVDQSLQQSFKAGKQNNVTSKQ